VAPISIFVLKKEEEVMNHFVILGLGVLLLITLLYSEKTGQPLGRIVTKSLLSLLFVITVFIQPGAHEAYTRYLKAGLILCLGGDVFLALSGLKWFRAGLAAFLLGHGFYILAFHSLIPFNGWFSPGDFLILAVSLGACRWLWPHLGAMKVPVLAYVAVITLMVFGAWAVFERPALPLTGTALVFFGAVLFYLSDLLVARDQFIRKAFSNRLIGLPLYYAGQFLLAFSPGFF
jgi:uncharacterized membrane protein YhhN